MLQSISDFFASGYNLLLFTLAIWGAIRFGIFVVGRPWHWGVKAVSFVFVGVAIGGYVKYMQGGPKTDLRVVTELCATAGAIFASEWLFRHVSGGWGRTGIVVTTGVFLAITWTQTADRLVGAVPAVPSIMANVFPFPAQVPPAQDEGEDRDLCDDTGISPYQREQLGC
ncbi:hypothetical protein HZA87_04235 [Candidatus Uhrbacteria bacterium]|nr:hypothetical protein [Candidatus Uhrbacteria bacterium]